MNQPDQGHEGNEERLRAWSTVESLLLQTEQAFSKLVTSYSSGEVTAEEITAARARMKEIRDRCDAEFERAFGAKRARS